MSISGRKLLTYSVAIVLIVTVAATVVPSPVGIPEPPEKGGFDDADNPQHGPRNLLTVLMEYTDLPTDVPADFIEDQIFGPRPSLNDYYKETSYNDFYFTNKGHFAWITAWDDPGTASDDESTWAYWEAWLPSDPHNGGTLYSWGLKSLDENHIFDFAQFDLNDDGDVDLGKELAVLVILSHEPGNRGGATRGMPALTLDGKTVDGAICAVTEDSPWITLYAHELGHQTLSLTDYYGIQPQPIGHFTLMGWSGAGGWNTPIGPPHLDPYSKLKLDWYSGTVVSSDGWYTIHDAETNDEVFILHDPDHGKKEYFMVENRWKGTSYDDSHNLIDPLEPPLPPANAPITIPDEGLLIWHVDEDREWDGTLSGNIPKVNLTRRINDDNQAAFNGDDPDNYDFYDSSSPRNAKWNDGTNSKTGVWCVSNSAASMRAWLDVPGPGILPCPIIAGAASTPGSPATFEIKLTNTGDSSDTFVVGFIGLDSDLSQVPPPAQALSSKETSIITIDVIPDKECTTAPGVRTLTLRVQSLSNPFLYTEIPLYLEVLPFGDPQATIIPSFAETDPNATVIYSVQITNGGNVDDTFDPQFFSFDFGSTYMASPSAIPDSWVVFSPSAPSAPACGVTTAIMSITVPWDWAAMEDATYDFWVEVWSSVSPVEDTVFGQLLVHATPMSMMFWVKAEIEQLIEDVEALPDSDVKDGLHDKASAALNKVIQGLNRYGQGDDPPSSNHFRTTQNILRAFIHLLHAQSGKQLTVLQASNFEAQVNTIIDHIDTILVEI